MDHHVAVAVLDAGDDLLEEVSRLVLAETTLLHDVVEELAALDVLHDHVDVVRGLEDLIQADDVRVHEQPQDLDLPANLLLHVDGLDLLAVQDLDGHLVPGEDVLGHLDLAEGADPERLAHPVVREVYLSAGVGRRRRDGQSRGGERARRGWEVEEGFPRFVGVFFRVGKRADLGDGTPRGGRAGASGFRRDRDGASGAPLPSRRTRP